MSSAGDLRLPGLCLAVILGAGCSVDTSKLRAPAAAVRDGASEGWREAGFAEAGGSDANSDGGGVDAPTAPPDLPGADQLATGDDGGDVSASDAASDPSAPEDIPTASDPPLPAADAADSAGNDGDVPDAAGVEGGGGSGGADGGLDGSESVGGAGGAGGTGGAGGAGGTGGAVVDPDLVLWYRFDESSGTVAADSAAPGSGGADGTLGTAGTSGSATFTSDCRVGTHALGLAPSPYGYNQGGGYVTTSAPASLAPGPLTIALWVKLADASSAQDWARIFDFGSGTGATQPYFYMTARASDGSRAIPRFGITNVGHGSGSVQRLDGPSPLAANVWYHVAVVLPAGASYTGSLYIDGVVAATNDAMTLHLSDVGPTTQNWLGRSPYPTDPFFSGWLDDFRIYRRALSAAEIAALVALR